MSRLREVARVIPRAALVSAMLLHVGVMFILVLGPLRHEQELLEWDDFRKMVLALLVPLPIALYALLIGYVYGDARRRQMRHVLWAWLALVPYFLGVIAYFILRDPLPRPCPSCQAVSLASFVFCPHCGAALRPNCPQCGKAVEHAWANCAYCGLKLPQPQNQKSPV